MYETHQREIEKYDDMVDRLSMAKATGELNVLHGTSTWEVYLQGREAQINIEAELARALAKEDKGREGAIALLDAAYDS